MSHTAYAPIARTSSVPWSEEVDVVVVGAGGSGFTAGIMASESGSQVIVLEKASEIGTAARIGDI